MSRNNLDSLYLNTLPPEMCKIKTLQFCQVLMLKCSDPFMFSISLWIVSNNTGALLLGIHAKIQDRYTLLILL